MVSGGLLGTRWAAAAGTPPLHPQAPQGLTSEEHDRDGLAKAVQLQPAGADGVHDAGVVDDLQGGGGWVMHAGQAWGPVLWTRAAGCERAARQAGRQEASNQEASRRHSRDGSPPTPQVPPPLHHRPPQHLDRDAGRARTQLQVGVRGGAAGGGSGTTEAHIGSSGGRAARRSVAHQQQRLPPAQRGVPFGCPCPCPAPERAPCLPSSPKGVAHHQERHIRLAGPLQYLVCLHLHHLSVRHNHLLAVKLLLHTGHKRGGEMRRQASCKAAAAAAAAAVAAAAMASTAGTARTAAAAPRAPSPASLWAPAAARCRPPGRRAASHAQRPGPCSARRRGGDWRGWVQESCSTLQGQQPQAPCMQGDAMQRLVQRSSAPSRLVQAKAGAAVAGGGGGGPACPRCSLDGDIPLIGQPQAHYVKHHFEALGAVERAASQRTGLVVAGARRGSPGRMRWAIGNACIQLGAPASDGGAEGAAHSRALLFAWVVVGLQA